MVYSVPVEESTQKQLTAEENHYLSLWQEAVRLAKGTPHDPSDIYTRFAILS